MATVRDHTALLSGDYWTPMNGVGPLVPTSVFITYSFETAAAPYLAAQGYSDSYMQSFQPLSAAEKTAARAALKAWADASGIVFLEVPASQGDIRFGSLDFGFGPAEVLDAAGYSYFPFRAGESETGGIGGDLFINNAIDTSWYLPYLMMHEIGHAIGLKHPFDGTTTLAADLDIFTQTVMSYSGDAAAVSGLGPLDLSAVRAIYGTTDGANLVSWSWNAATLTLTQTAKETADRLYGTAVKDIIKGMGGNDTIRGYLGNDVLDGGAGNDTLEGGWGNDTYIGGAGDDTINAEGVVLPGYDLDTIDYSSSTASVAVNLSGLASGYHATGAAIGRDLLYNISNIIGSAFADTISCDYSSINSENFIDGRGGADTMWGCDGDDTYVLDNTGDAVIELAFEGNDTVQAAYINLNLGLYANVENAVALGSLNLRLIGTEAANRLYGNSGNNFLDGRGGADVLSGGLGNDTYVIDAGDTITDTGGSADLVQATGRDVALSSLAGGQIEKAELLGTSNNYVAGNGLSNSLKGNAGDNSISGSLGIDYLFGGAGKDAFVFNTALNATTNRDTIYDFSPIDDTIKLENSVAGTFTLLSLAGPLNASLFKANATGIANEADDRIVYNTATGALYYDTNGNAAGGTTQFATLYNKPVLTAADFLVI